MNWQEYADQPQRTPITLVSITLDACGNVFGQSPCSATGEPCYNTFYTCKDRQNYLKASKEYLFSTAAAPALPPESGGVMLLED